jgi:hypothetical protein
MTAPQWLRPGVYGAVIGALSIRIIGFVWGGRVTGGTSNERALAMSRTEVVAAMVPVCLGKAGADPERNGKLDLIRTPSSYQRRDALMSTGWTTVPGTEAPDRDIAQACLAALAP